MRVIDIAAQDWNHRVDGVVVMRLQMAMRRIDVNAISPGVAAHGLADANLIPACRIVKLGGEN